MTWLERLFHRHDWARTNIFLGTDAGAYTGAGLRAFACSKCGEVKWKTEMELSLRFYGQVTCTEPGVGASSYAGASPMRAANLQAHEQRSFEW